jgi:hypothetical protein
MTRSCHKCQIDAKMKVNYEWNAITDPVTVVFREFSNMPNARLSTFGIFI